MTLFLLTFFLLYGGVHVYTFVKLRYALTFGTLPAIALAIFFLVMVMAPIVVRIAEKSGFESTASFIAYLAYTWMGFLFLFFSASIAIDLYSLVLLAAGAVFQRDFTSFALSSRTAFFVFVAWSLTAGIYGFFEARRITSRRIVLETAKLPPETKKFVIVQISDVHLGLIVRQERLGRAVELVKAAHPDMLVSTGDLVDGQLNSLAGLSELLSEIRPLYGKFAITGNHEFYAGLQQSLSFTERAGFTLLRDASVDVAGIVTVAGVDDPAVGWTTSSRHTAEAALLSELPDNRFRLFLKHRPKVEPGTLGLFDLQLSGHVHKGQIFPFNLVTYLFYPVRTGFSLYPHHSSLYVSRGTGTWGPPIRFLAKPEVTVIELVNKNGR